PLARTENEDTHKFLNGQVDEVPDWQELGFCWESQNPIFFSVEFPDMMKAADICYDRCPVRLQCLRSGIGMDHKRLVQPGGVWGGYTPDQRNRFRKRLIAKINGN